MFREGSQQFQRYSFGQVLTWNALKQTAAKALLAKPGQNRPIQATIQGTPVGALSAPEGDNFRNVWFVSLGFAAGFAPQAWWDWGSRSPPGEN